MKLNLHICYRTKNLSKRRQLGRMGERKRERKDNRQVIIACLDFNRLMTWAGDKWLPLVDPAAGAFVLLPYANGLVSGEGSGERTATSVG